MVCTEVFLFVNITILYPSIIIPVPVVSWDDHEVSIPEGDNRQVCFSSDIGTAQPYTVMVDARRKGASPATLSTHIPTLCLMYYVIIVTLKDQRLNQFCI